MTERSIVAMTVLLLIGVPTLAAAQQGGAAPMPFQRAPAVPMEQIQGFHVVLVVGETERGKSSTEKLTEGAARALKDMGEFLPYKSYRVLDAQWSSCCSGPHSKVSGRLRGVIGIPGPNGTINLVHRPYTFSITARSSASGIQTRFVLAAQDGRPASLDADERVELQLALRNAQDDVVTAEGRVEEVRRRVEVGTAPALELREAENRLTQARRQTEALKAKTDRLETGGELGIIDSSFTMAVGETVVVGTSKLGGDDALIAVVTAVRKAGGTARN